MARRLFRRATPCTCAECAALRRRSNLFAITAIDAALWALILAAGALLIL